ncbi:MAG: hypothetical protein C4586_03710 [Anaerolineaceae bacterium]|nr:MAG: hypothetical protein C4586_03710 [Anaerolineaceae bacterium]
MIQTQTQIYGVVLPIHIAQRARVVAAMNGKSRSSLMRDLLLDYLKGCESVDPSPLGVTVQDATKRKKRERKSQNHIDR